MFPHRFAIAACATLIGGCQSEPSNTGEPPDSRNGSPLPITRFRSDSLPYTVHSGFSAETTLVIRDASVWTETWHRLHAGVAPEPPVPSIDFGQEMVVLTAMGTRNSGGYAIKLTGADEEDQTVTIRARATSPGPGCMTTSVLTEPVDLGRLPRRDGTVVFDIERRVLDCGN